MSQANAMRQAERMRGFLADVESLARSASDGRWPRLGQIEGTDPSGTVSFVVDDNGGFVTVDLASDWWHTLGVSGLPAGLKAAQQNAREKLTVARLTFRRLIGPPRAAPAPSAADGFQPRYGLSRTTDFEELISSWRAMTEESYRRFNEYERRRNTGGGTTPVVVEGPEGLVRLTLENGVITEVGLAEWRISGEMTERLAADIRAALQQYAGG
jgi:hypothetical protein